jgi:hypothetical protein
MTKISVLITGSQEDGATFTLTVDSLKFEKSGFAMVLRQLAEVDLHYTKPSQETTS